MYVQTTASSSARACEQVDNAGEAVGGGWHKVLCVCHALAAELGQVGSREVSHEVGQVDRMEAIHAAHRSRSWREPTALTNMACGGTECELQATRSLLMKAFGAAHSDRPIILSAHRLVIQKWAHRSCAETQQAQMIAHTPKPAARCARAPGTAPDEEDVLDLRAVEPLIQSGKAGTGRQDR